jgi:MFS family permease
MPALVASPRGVLSTRATTLYAAITAITFSATSSAPTPLYHLYLQDWGLSPALVTVIFAAYAFAMLAAFLTVARLSDYVGRKPMILTALLLNAAALVLFITAGNATELILARIVQGLGTGIALTTLGAAILDTDKVNGALYNSVTAFIGLMVGSLLAGVLVAFAPMPGQLVYIVLLIVTLAEAGVLAVAPETTAGKPGALTVLRPHVSVPKAAMGPLIRLLPLNIAGWALGGFYLSLMPTLVTIATGAKSLFIGAAVVSALMLTAAITVFAFRKLAPARMLIISMLGLIAGIAITLAAVYLQSAPLMILGTVLAGVGFGNAYSGNLRTLLPLAGEQERAGLLAAYFVESYLSFAIPAPVFGLVTTTYVYGAVLIVLIMISLIASIERRPQRTLEI